jgi:MoxR-like ATPase
MKNNHCWNDVERLLSVVAEVGMNLILWGPSGTGKSHMARRHGLAPGQLVHTITLTDETPAAELRGLFLPGDHGFRWQHGPAIRAWLDGSRLVLNEVDKASSDVLSFLLALMDHSAVAAMTLPSGENVSPTPGFHVVATSNVSPDQLPAALRDRFAACVHVDTVHVEALRQLPQALRDVAANTSVIEQAQRRVSVRSWHAFATLIKHCGDEAFAARAVFGPRAADVLAAMRVSRVGK